MYKYKKLSEPFKIGSLVINNRFCTAPMGTHQHSDRSGGFTDETITYHVERARGGFGIIYTGAQMDNSGVDADGDSIPLINAEYYRRTGLKLTEACHRYGAKVFSQISFGPGRSGLGLKTPSEIGNFWIPEMKTEALTVDEIKRKIKSCVETAVLCKEAGFDGVELHAMHCGYLIDSFALCIMNQRTDEYGGSLENRLRVTKELVEGIKAACGQDFPVTIRVGLRSYMKALNEGSIYGEDEAGRTIEEAVEICKLLESFGFDALNVDIGTYESAYYVFAPMYLEKGFTLKFAKEVKKEIKIPLLVGGCRLDEPDLCLEAVSEDTGDAVVIGRGSIADPFLPQKIMRNKFEDVRPCIGCNNCINSVGQLRSVSCAVNPVVGHEETEALQLALEKKNIIVVGGGLSGMEAAVSATRRGHKVSLYEKADKLGGLAIAAGSHDFKRDIARLIEWYKRNIAELGIEVKLNTELTAEKVKALNPDVVILSTGSKPIELKFEGSDRDNVIGFLEAILEKRPAGKNVVVVGAGQTGCEIAYEYAMEGKNVTLVEALDDILSAGAVVPIMNKWALNDLLEYYKVNIMTNSRLVSVDDAGVNVQCGDEMVHIKADTVVTAIGLRPTPTMEKDLVGADIEVYLAGDSRTVGDVKTSISAGYDVARRV